ncbi:hypothetical protein B1B05_02805 [Domibacillus enclensis]|uniref:Uncharacterized protein n=1 Tax=Domibacillus enclensis TaxID=1017273 RepID=A0ABX4ED84_9BACI|nr:hypothetical protein B1B05_02805 [Domibacillus enclensis]
MAFSFFMSNIKTVIFLEKTCRGSGLPAPLFYVANAEPAQSARLFQPVRSSHGSLRRPPCARCDANETMVSSDDTKRLVFIDKCF